MHKDDVEIAAAAVIGAAVAIAISVLLVQVML